MTLLRIPGFIDLQVNGFMGVDFSSETLTEEAFRQAGHALIAQGTAAFLPTLITGHEARLHRNISLIGRALKTDAKLARHVLGFHLEGPFISSKPGAVGAHDPAAVHVPDMAFFDQLNMWSEGRLRLLTLAAEVPGAADLARHAKACGVAVSCGHHLQGRQISHGWRRRAQPRLRTLATACRTMCIATIILCWPVWLKKD